MKRKSLATLVLSSFLTTSTAFASNVLSDASKGFIPEDIRKEGGAKLQKWQEDNMEKLTARAELHGLIYDQVERLFAPLSRKGDNKNRAIANAVCDYLEERADRSQYLAELFAGHRGLDVKMPAAEKMKDGGLPQTGRHIALVRAISTLTEELTTIKTKLEAQPKLIEEWKSETTRLKKESEATKSTTSTLKEKESKAVALLKEAEQAYETAENNLIALQKEMGFLESQLAELQQKSREEIQKASPEPTEEISPETKNAWRASFEQLNKDKKDPEELLGVMREALPKLMEAKELCRKDKDEKAQDLAGVQNEVESNENEHKKLLTDLKALEEKIEVSKTEKEKLAQRRIAALADQKNLQEAADRYALVKYLTYLNLYSALPNDNYDCNGFKEAGFALSTLSPHSMPVTLKLANDRAETVGAYNARKVAKREVEKFKTIHGQQIEKEQEELNQKAQDTIQQGVARYEHNSNSVSISDEIVKYAKINFGINNSFSIYQKQPGNHNGYPQKMDLLSFVQESSKTLDPLRADRQIKNSMDKWSAKISGGKDALADRLGLSSALLNKSFAIQTLPHMLSFNELSEAFPDVQYVSGKDRQIWSIGQMQLKVNHFDSLVSQDALAHRRIDPIYAFVVEKARSSKKMGEKFDGRIQAVKQESPEHEALITHAFLKTISYMNMTYALTHDENGNKLPELKLIDPALEQFIKEPLPRLDHVMATRALKWGQRVKQHGQKFIKDHGLEAHIFTPVEIERK